MLRVLIVNILFSHLTAQVFNQTGSFSITVNTAQFSDVCHKFHATHNGLFHLSKQGSLQFWQDFSYGYSTTNVQNTSSVLDFTVDNNQQIKILGANQIIYYTINSGTITFAETQSFVNVPKKIIYSDSAIFQLFKDGVTSDRVIRIDGLGTQQYYLDSVNGDIAISPDGLTLVLWDLHSNVHIFDALTLTELHRIYPQNPVPDQGRTNQITFNSESTKIIIETDQHNPLIIIDITTGLTYYSVVITDVITFAMFFQPMDQYILILGSTYRYIVDLTTNTLYRQAETDHFRESYFVTTIFNNKLIGCNASTLIELTFNDIAFATDPQLDAGTFIIPSIVNVTNTTNTTSNNTILSNTTNSTNTTTNETVSYFNSSFVLTEKINSSQFYIIFNFTETQQKVISGINTGMSSSLEVTNVLSSFMASTPITIYCLGFLNFFSLSSLYVLFNVRIPKQIYDFLEQIYLNLNSNIFQIIDLDISVSPISTERVNNSRPLYFGVTTDVLSSNFPQFLLASINLLLILAWKLLSNCCRKESLFRKLYQMGKTDIICGKVIGLLLQTTLPWSFLLLQNGFSGVRPKMNYLISLIFFFLTFFFPLFYLYILMREKKIKLILALKRRQERQLQRKLEKRRRAINQSSFRMKQQQKIQYDNQKSNLRHKNTKATLKTQKNYNFNNKKIFRLRDTLTAEVLEEFFNCLSNSLYPLFVLLENPFFFLVGILLFTICNMVVGAKQIKKSINSFFITIYPLVFHICFLVFYYFQQNEILIYAQIICLLCLLLGSVHITLYLLIKALQTFYRFAKRNCFNQTVSPTNVCQQERQQNEKQISMTKEQLQKKETKIIKLNGVFSNEKSKTVQKLKKVKTITNITKHRMKVVYK